MNFGDQKDGLYPRPEGRGFTPHSVIADHFFQTLLYVQDPTLEGDLTAKPPRPGSLLFEAQMFATPAGVWAVSDTNAICPACLEAKKSDFRVAAAEDIALINRYEAEQRDR